jgi:hypothetical protein
MAITKWSISASKKAPFRARTGLRTLGDQQTVAACQVGAAQAPQMPKAEVQRVLFNLKALLARRLGARF